MQDKSKLPEKVFKFKLPVGAIVSGMRHLGDGVFAGYPLPEVGKLLMMDGAMPIVIEGVVHASDREDWDGKLHVDLVDDPLHGIEAARVINLVQIPGGNWSDTHIALGLSDEEGRSRTEARTRYGEIVHEARRVAFREVYGRYSGKTWGGIERGWIDATETAGNEDAAADQCCGKCEKPAGPQFAKVFQTERGQIVAMLHQDSDQNPAILLWFDAGIDGLALTHLALGFTDDEDGEDKARVAFDNLDQSGVERVVFKQIDNIREHFGVTGD